MNSTLSGFSLPPHTIYNETSSTPAESSGNTVSAGDSRASVQLSLRRRKGGRSRGGLLSLNDADIGQKTLLGE